PPELQVVDGIAADVRFRLLLPADAGRPHGTRERGDLVSHHARPRRMIQHAVLADEGVEAEQRAIERDGRGGGVDGNRAVPAHAASSYNQTCAPERLTSRCTEGARRRGFSRMVRLGREITAYIVCEYGRLADDGMQKIKNRRSGDQEKKK